MKDVGLLGNPQQTVAGTPAPGVHVRLDARVSGKELEDLAHLEMPDRLCGLDNGERARQTRAVEHLVWEMRWHFGHDNLLAGN
jgi:hypothetical protein